MKPLPKLDRRWRLLSNLWNVMKEGDIIFFSPGYLGFSHEARGFILFQRFKVTKMKYDNFVCKPIDKDGNFITDHTECYRINLSRYHAEAFHPQVRTAKKKYRKPRARSKLYFSEEEQDVADLLMF